MRINKYVAAASSLSRRSADLAIADGRVSVNDQAVTAGYQVNAGDRVKLDGKDLVIDKTCTIALNKPTGYVVSRDGQGSKTVYDLLPDEFQNLNPVGRLDKGSSGLLLLTNDGELAQELTHPSKQKKKIYDIELYLPLQATDAESIRQGVQLQDGISKLDIKGSGKTWQVTMHEGRNRQIRRTFEEVGYTVAKLHRIQFGDYRLGDLASGKWLVL